MVDQSKGKRKAAAGMDGAGDQRGPKRSKGGSGGKWKTPYQKAAAASAPAKMEAGDVGIWATCVRGKENKATEELKHIFEDYAERFYGPLSSGENKVENSDDEEDGGADDIEAMVKKEVASISAERKQPSKDAMLTVVKLETPCLIFFKTRAPIEPVDFVHRICQDAVANPEGRRHRFVNRLTPMTLLGRSTEKGIEEVARAVLGEHFTFTGDKEKAPSGTSYTYALRPTIRNNKQMKRDDVIKQVASLISAEKHRVNLNNPDKVILIEIYQNICGMSVVDGDWDSLKRFNLAELYAKNEEAPDGEADAKKTDAKKTDAKEADAKEADAREADAKKAEPKPEVVATGEGEKKEDGTEQGSS